MKILKVEDCSLVDVVDVWNEGFQDYFVPVQLKKKAFLNRLVKEDIEADQSFVVERNGQLQGVLLNGFRSRDGQTIAWNGGTAVIQAARGTGVGKLLIEATMALYKERQVAVATLEVIKENEPAIRLYEKFGYKKRDELIIFEGVVNEIVDIAKDEFHLVQIRPELLPHVTFYERDVPWQCSYESNQHADAVVYYNKEHEALGYALFSRIFDDNGTQMSTAIYQLHALPQHNEQLIPLFLQAIVGETGYFTTLNTPANSAFAHYLMKVNTKEKTRQYWMEKHL